MIDNIKVDNRLVKFVKEHKGAVVIVSTGVLIAGIILASIDKPQKEVFPMYVPQETKIVETTKEPVHQEKNPFYTTYYVRVALNQIMRLEPMSDGKFVDRIEGNNDVELLYIDGDYALICYTDSHGMDRLGFVETDRIAHLEDVGLRYQANKMNMYGEITNNNCRIQNNRDVGPDEPNILTRGKKGEFVKVIGEVREGNKTWYIVTYRSYIGYMDPANLRLISEEEFNNTVNTNFVEIVGTQVRFRSSPKKDKNNILVELDKGLRLPVIGTDGDWYYVYYNGTYGYVSMQSNCTRLVMEDTKPAGLSYLHLEKENIISR